MEAMLDRFTWLVVDLTYQLGIAKPATWLLLGAAMAGLFIFLIRPAR